jgi:hypothetical protein
MYPAEFYTQPYYLSSQAGLAVSNSWEKSPIAVVRRLIGRVGDVNKSFVSLFLSLHQSPLVVLAFL